MYHSFGKNILFNASYSVSVITAPSTNTASLYKYKCPQRHGEWFRALQALHQSLVTVFPCHFRFTKKTLSLFHHEQNPQGVKCLKWMNVFSASTVRHLYLRGGAGVGSMTKIYGGRKRNGVCPAHYSVGSKNVARKVLQALELLKMIEKDPNGYVTSFVLVFKHYFTTEWLV